MSTGDASLFDGFLGATAFRVLVAVDTVAEIAAPRPNWKDVAEPSSPVVPAAKQWVQTGERWRFLCLSGTGLGLEMEEPVPSWDALSSPVNALKRCRKERNRP